MPTQDTTIGGTSSNSYVTLAECNSFWSDKRLYSSSVDAASDDSKKRAIIWATQAVDDSVAWYGEMADSKQALQWPRVGAFDRSGTEISSSILPQFLKDAVAELAGLYIEENRDADPDTKGFSSLSVGSLAMTIDKLDRRHVLPDSVRRRVSWYGRVKGTGGGAVQLGRT